MANIPPRLAEIAQQVHNNKTPQRETVRTLLSWFSAQRRGYWIVREIRQVLKKLKIDTMPDFEFAYLDAYVNFIPAPSVSEALKSIVTSVTATNGIPVEITPSIEEISDSVQSVIVGGSVADPTYRIGKLASANQPVISVKPDTDLREAITIMLANDFSQLPVMQSEREVKGMISWNSIGTRLALGRECNKVRDCIEPHQEISADTSLFAAIGLIAQHEYVLIRDSERKISGIVTTSDLSLQFRQLGEPFLLIGEIENHIRRLIDGKFIRKELAEVRDPNDIERKVESVADLTFGEYIKLLENPLAWEKVKIPIDRKTFTGLLDKIREIRNDVMHFDPDGLPEDDLETLRKFVRFLQNLRELGAV